MKIAINHVPGSFSEHWVNYCRLKRIPHKIVNSYQSDIIEQMEDCDALMWHHYHLSSKDILFAKQLLFALEMTGKIVFPDFRSGWHFDDKVGQKYLLESIKAPLVPSYVFYSKTDALSWARITSFPKVFKLRGGSSGSNVRLAIDLKSAERLIRIAFGRGFANYNAHSILKDRYLHYKRGKEPLWGLLKGIGQLIIKTKYAKIAGRERGYIYFQDFIPGNTHDIRITYVADRIFALRRRVRKGDFRASGGGLQEHDMSRIPIEAVKIGFSVAEQLKLQTAAFDFVISETGPLIVEVSYGFGYDPQQFDFGYWDRRLKWHEGKFNPYGWMVDLVVNQVAQKQ